MTDITFRRYRHPEDYRNISEFLIAHYQPANADGNWLEPAWEYMHGHPYLDKSSLDRIGIWEQDGSIVAVANYESRLGEAFFQFHPAYLPEFGQELRQEFRHLRDQMLDYAEQHLTGVAEADGRPYLNAYINDFDETFLSLVSERGYERHPDADRPLARLAIPDSFPAVTLPEGFRLTSLAEECDWARVHRVMWRGFNHPGEPPAGADELEDRRKMFDTPTARRDLKIAVAAPNGDFVSFCGMFYQPDNRYCYVEPVATDPSYRRMGLGRAAVLEGIRRCAESGAVEAFVGSDQPFYLALGFRVIYTSQCWRKIF